MRSSLARLSILLAASICTTAACSYDSVIVIEVNAELNIPKQANQLNVVVSAAGTAKQLLDINEDLTAGQGFPLEVLVEPSPRTPPMLDLRVEARLNDVPVAGIHVQHDWKDGSLNRVELPPLQPVP